MSKAVRLYVVERGHELEQPGSRGKDWGEGTKRGEIKRRDNGRGKEKVMKQA